MIAAATAIITEEGLEGFTLRKASRRAGVSAMAPAHHFGDVSGLLTAVATEGFQRLGDALQSTPDGLGRREALVAMGRAYVDFAMSNPGIFRLMWRKNLLDMDVAGHVAAGRRAFDALDRAVRPDGPSAASPSDAVLGPSVACWSLVHGFAMLALDGAFSKQGGGAGDLPALLEAALAQLDV